MLRFQKALRAWGTSDFEAELKREIEQLGCAQLPLQQGLSATSYAVDAPIAAMIISVADAGARIHAKAGIFFSGIVAGCSCADDPTSVEQEPEYCVMLFEIDKADGCAAARVLSE